MIREKAQAHTHTHTPFTGETRQSVPFKGKTYYHLTWLIPQEDFINSYYFNSKTSTIGGKTTNHTCSNTWCL